MKKVSDYLPKIEKEAARAVVQGYVPAELRQQVIEHMLEEKKNGNKKMTWDQLLEACLRAYLGEKRRA